MITLLTGQPGNGKTSKIINEIRKDLAEGRTVYTVGIPKLKLPVIELTRSQVQLWHLRTEVLQDEKSFIVDNFSPSSMLQYKNFIKSKDIVFSDDFINATDREKEGVYVLNNIVEGAKIYVDEAQKGFEPSGTKIPEHISYLSEHRHHGLDFVFITQYPFLVHQTIRALVTIHWHIRNTWKGRKIHEFPEWQEKPQSQQSLSLAISSKYDIDKTTFNEYESASIHTKVEHKKPFFLYLILISFIAVPLLAYFSVTRIYAKTQPQSISQELKNDLKQNSLTSDNLLNTSSSIAPPLVHEKPRFIQMQVVSTSYDWSTIAACVSMRNRCSCYGDAGDLLAVPPEVCRSAVSSGWAGRKKPDLTPSNIKVKNERSEIDSKVLF